jgi:hypothetical protein
MSRWAVIRRCCSTSNKCCTYLTKNSCNARAQLA